MQTDIDRSVTNSDAVAKQLAADTKDLTTSRAVPAENGGLLRELPSLRRALIQGPAGPGGW